MNAHHMAIHTQIQIETKVDGLETQNSRLKHDNDELTHQNQDLSTTKQRIQQEFFELQRVVQELDSSSGTLHKAKVALQSQLDDAKRALDEETRTRNTISIQVLQY